MWIIFLGVFLFLFKSLLNFEILEYKMNVLDEIPKRRKYSDFHFIF